MNSPTESSVWSCFVPNTGPPGYLCFTNTQRFNGLDPSLPFLVPSFQGCAANNYTHHPTSADCLSECLLLYPPSLSPNVTTKYCQSCTLMENGQVAYDCHNIFTDDVETTSSCLAKDLTGQCVDAYFHWQCRVQGNGYRCGTSNYLYTFSTNNPAFPNEDPSTDYYTEIFCPHDFSGNPVTSCSEPICDIRSADVLDTCSKCEVLPDGTFSYDCAEVLPNISCPVRWPNATCTKHGNEFVNGLSEAILD